MLTHLPIPCSLLQHVATIHLDVMPFALQELAERICLLFAEFVAALLYLIHVADTAFFIEK